MIKIKNLHWKYGEKKILEDINLEIERGKFYSIIGPNGSGKTTLLRNIARILEPQKNTILIDNKDIMDFQNKELAKKIASVPQNTEISFDFSCHDIVMMGRTPYLKRFETEKAEDKIIVREAMETTNTWELRNKSINELSGGERQRVIISRALAQEPDIILLDEPISHLDIHHQVRIMDNIKALNQKKKFSVIAVFHDLNLAAQYSDTLILLNHGKIISLGKPEEVITKKNIKEVYHMDVYMMKNPTNGKPHMIVLPTVNKSFSDDINF
ncbi:MAG: heme ABC transporter ATP-binding protein [Epulopiscium sp.]|jgi:iron complex transport system ATP-binding protein|nr:heme ABC transporter ATP-binding protein [Candidatus Epulonipiscium sp.]